MITKQACATDERRSRPGLSGTLAGGRDVGYDLSEQAFGDFVARGLGGQIVDSDLNPAGSGHDDQPMAVGTLEVRERLKGGVVRPAPVKQMRDEGFRLRRRYVEAPQEVAKAANVALKSMQRWLT